MRPQVMTIGTDNPSKLLDAIRAAAESDVPNRDPEVTDDGEGDDSRTTFIVQLVLDRPYKNHVEEHALAHVLGDIDGAATTYPAMLAVVVGNPFDKLGVEIPHTFAVFTMRADTREEVERLVTEAVTETAPAPFGITTTAITAVRRRNNGRD